MKRFKAEQYIDGIVRGDRVMLAKAITVIESTRAEDRVLAGTIVSGIMPRTGGAIRIGITGVPGVGKSSFIEVLGTHIINTGKRIAVLTIDPSSQRTAGSILGDKTRMEELSRNPGAFIRPSASGSTLGGVAGKTREAMLLCEAAGYDVIIIETVGVGQSEVAVKNMVDFFLLLMLAGAGDELQGIKKGIMEMADAVVITKADGDNVTHAHHAMAEYQQALHLFPATPSGWTPQVLSASAHTQTGIDQVWQTVLTFNRHITDNGFITTNRSQQNISWMHEYFDLLIKADLNTLPGLNTEITNLEEGVNNHVLSPYAAAAAMLQAYHDAVRRLGR